MPLKKSSNRIVMEPPLKKQRISSEEDLHLKRTRNDLRLKSRFEHIFEKFSRDFSNVGDEIDMATGQVVVNNGHLYTMRNEQDIEGVGEEEDELAADGLATSAENPLVPTETRVSKYSITRDALAHMRELEELAVEPKWRAPILPMLELEPETLSDHGPTIGDSGSMRSPSPAGESLWAVGEHLTVEAQISTPLVLSTVARNHRWTPTEDRLLTNFKRSARLSWNDMEQHFPGRSWHAIRSRWSTLQKKSESVVQSTGHVPSSPQAESIPLVTDENSTSKQPISKYHRWTPVEDALLAHLKTSTNIPLSELGHHFPGLPGQSIQSHWNYIQNRKDILGHELSGPPAHGTSTSNTKTLDNSTDDTLTRGTRNPPLPRNTESSIEQDIVDDAHNGNKLSIPAVKIPAGSTKIRLTDLTIECEESLKSKAPTKRKNYGRNTPRGVMVAIENSPRPSGRIQTPATMMKQAILPAENISPSEPNDDIRCSNRDCGSTTTYIERGKPKWRRAPDGSRLCRNCGMYLKANGVHRPLELVIKQTKTKASRHGHDPHQIALEPIGTHSKSQANHTTPPISALPLISPGLDTKAENAMEESKPKGNNPAIEISLPATHSPRSENQRFHRAHIESSSSVELNKPVQNAAPGCSTGLANSQRKCGDKSLSVDPPNTNPSKSKSFGPTTVTETLSTTPEKTYQKGSPNAPETARSCLPSAGRRTPSSIQTPSSAKPLTKKAGSRQDLDLSIISLFDGSSDDELSTFAPSTGITRRIASPKITPKRRQCDGALRCGRSFCLACS